MTANSSEAMMNLLKELALLKTLDVVSESATGSNLETSELALRETRRQEIAEQIKALAEPAGK